MQTELAADLVVQTIKGALAPLASRLAIAEAQIAALEARPQLEYLRTFDQGQKYARGNCVDICEPAVCPGGAQCPSSYQHGRRFRAGA